MEIITGRTGEPHVYAADDAELYKLFLGDGDFRLPTGNKFSAVMQSAQQIRINDGSLIMQGRLAKTRASDGFDVVNLDNGTVGWKRVDIVVAEYTQTTEQRQIEIEGQVVTVTDAIESVDLAVVKGTPNQSSYIAPSITTGNIDLGETHQVALWEVRFDGINNDGLIDRRPALLDTTPIQTALDYARGAVANVQSYLNMMESQLESELDRIRGVAGVAPLTIITAHDLVSASGVLTVPSAYTYTSGDVFVLYLNGLREQVDKYIVASGTNALTVTLDYTTSSIYDDVEIEVWRPE